MKHRIITPDDARRLLVLGDNQTVRLTGEDTNGAYTLIEQFNDPGVGVPPHVHENEDETFHIIEGQVTFTIEDSTVVANAGTTIHVQRGIPHSFLFSGDTKSRVMLIVSPPGLETMFEELHDLPAGPSDMPTIGAICERYGIRFAA